MNTLCITIVTIFQVEARTGYGGGYNERGVVEYRRREPSSDDEYDEFGRRKRKRRSESDDKVSKFFIYYFLMTSINFIRDMLFSNSVMLSLLLALLKNKHLLKWQIMEFQAKKS